MVGALVDAASLPDLARGIDGLSQNPPPTARYTKEELIPKPLVLHHPDSPTEPLDPIADTNLPSPSGPIRARTLSKRPSLDDLLRRWSKSDKQTPTAVEVASPQTPTKNPWQASAARPDQQLKRNTGGSQKTAAAARARAGMIRGRQASFGPLSPNDFPASGQPVSPSRASPSVKSDSSSEHNMSVNGGAMKSPQYQCFAGTHTRSKSNSQSVRSHSSRAGTVPAGTLGDAIGFTFKNTTNFVHPDIPRRKETQHLTREADAAGSHMDRLNSLTSDGGWQNGWSVSGSGSASMSGHTTGPNGGLPDLAPGDLGPDDLGLDHLRPDDSGLDDLGPDDSGPDDSGLDDLGPDDLGPDGLGPDDPAPNKIQPVEAYKDIIIEEEEESSGRPFLIHVPSPRRAEPLEGSSLFSWSFDDAMRSAAPVRYESPTRVEPPETDRDDLSPAERRSNMSASSTPARRPSVNEGSSRLLRGQSLRVLRSRASSLSIGRRAQGDDYSDSSNPCTPVKTTFSNFSLHREPEAADAATRATNIAAARKAFEEKEAAKDRRQAELEAKRELRRKKSDTRWRRKASVTIDPTADCIEEEGTYTISRSNSRRSAKRSTSPDDQYDPLSRLPEQSCAESTNFPAYQDQSHPDHSMFSSAYTDREPSVFDDVDKGGIFPVVQMQSQVYEMDGQLYNEYGEAIDAHGVVQPDEQGSSESEDRGRRLSKTKVARGQLRKFSTWSRTRMLSRG